MSGKDDDPSGPVPVRSDPYEVSISQETRYDT
jgi:hypothetical protein